jgi:drug/metabolite transporter (DMT)-like permease
MVYGMSPFLLSVLLSLVSAMAYAGAAVLQEHVAGTTPESAFGHLRNGRWWASVGLNGGGALLHVAALAYGSLSLVQPLGALTIVFALPLAALFVRKPVSGAAWRGALLSTGGLAVLLAFTGAGGTDDLSGSARGMLAAATIGAVGALVLAARRMRRAPLRSVTLAVASGVAFGMSSVFTKIATDDWTDPLTLAMIALLAPAGLMLSQAAYRGGLSAPLATLTVVNPVVAAAVGIVAMGESLRYGATGTAVALLAGTVAAVGLAVLTRQESGTEAQPAVPAPAGAQVATAAQTATAAPAATAVPAATAAQSPAAAGAPARTSPSPVRVVPAQRFAAAEAVYAAGIPAAVPGWGHARRSPALHGPPRPRRRVLVGGLRGRGRGRSLVVAGGGAGAAVAGGGGVHARGRDRERDLETASTARAGPHSPAA